MKMQKLIRLFLLTTPLFVACGTHPPSAYAATPGPGADFTVSTLTTAIGAGTPSSAITLYVTNGPTTSSTTFTLSDGGAGGVFYPTSPITFPSGADWTQFVYTPPSTATGTVTLTATASGGIATAHSISLPIGTSTVFANDTLPGASGATLLGTTPAIGAPWQNTYLPTYIDASLASDGAGHVYQATTASEAWYFIPTVPVTPDHDQTLQIRGFDGSHNYLALIANSQGLSDNLNGYLLGTSNNSYFMNYAISNADNGALVGGAPGNPSVPTQGGTATVQLSVRSINGAQVLFAYAQGQLLGGFPHVDNRLSAGYIGIASAQALNSPTSGYLAGAITGRNTDWRAAPVGGHFYYISATGNDSLDGHSPATAWKSLAKVNSTTFVPGDTLSFNGGDTFIGTLQNDTLAGSPTAYVTITSYGTGVATINAGNGRGLVITNPQYLNINDLKLVGSGWTGSGVNLVPNNGETGILLYVGQTTGPRMQNITVSNTEVTGFTVGINFSTGSTGAVGFQNVVAYNNYVHDNVQLGINLQSTLANQQGPVDQNYNVYFGYNRVTNNPGDPNSGSGGVHGTAKTEAGGMQIGGTTGATIEHNYIADIAGFGGLNTGLTLGGSTAIVVTNSRSFRISQNEVARTKCSTNVDGSAIDADQDTQDGDIFGNLTYYNVGPSVQIGSYGGKTTSNIRVHHNISFNDVRGNNARNVSEQGALRLWGSTDSIKVFNNTSYMDLTSIAGGSHPSCFSFEIGPNTNAEFMNNICKSTVSPAFWANQTINPTHLGANMVALGNVYDLGSTPISNDDGTSYRYISSLSDWQAAGYESLSGVHYGVAGDAGLLSIGSFSPPTNGFIPSGTPITRVTNLDLTSSSISIGEGTDPSLAPAPLDLGPVSFHGTTPRPGSSVDAGAAPYIH